MIVLGNSKFVIGMKLAGIRESHEIRDREHGLEVLKDIDRGDFILANVSVVEMLPELEDYDNMVTVPDSPKDFAEMQDLKELIKSVVGIELEV